MGGEGAPPLGSCRPQSSTSRAHSLSKSGSLSSCIPTPSASPRLHLRQCVHTGTHSGCQKTQLCLMAQLQPWRLEARGFQRAMAKGDLLTAGVNTTLQA